LDKLIPKPFQPPGVTLKAPSFSYMRTILTDKFLSQCQEYRWT